MRPFYGSYHLKTHKSWKEFSEYIRKKEKNCFCCGRPIDWKKAHASHYHAGSICGKELFFSEINVQKSCPACNLFLHGNLPQFALSLQRKYGQDILEKLDAVRRKEKKEGIICRYTPEELETIYEKYTALVKSL